MNLTKIFPAVLLLVGSIVSANVFADEIKEMTPAVDYCSKATGLSQRMAEYIAREMKVSVSSISLIRAEPMNGTCSITVDTAKGPQSCMGGKVYSDGKDYWIGGNYCY